MTDETRQLLYALLEGGQQKLENGQQKLEGRLQKLEKGQQKLESGQQEIKNHLTKLESSIDLLAHKEWQNEREINDVKLQVESHLKEV